MSTAIEIQPSAVDPTVLTALGRVFVSELVPDRGLRIGIGDFKIDIDAIILEVDREREKAEGEIFIRSAIDEQVEAEIVLSGEDAEDGRGFDISHLTIQLRATEQRARAEFEASTLSAALKLSCELSLQVFDTGFDVTLTAFDSKLLEVGRLLQKRQTSYRLMTIERATGTDFGVLPSILSGEEVHTINFVYRSIVDRVFIDGVRDVKAVVPATEEGMRLFQRLRESPSLEFPPEVVTKTLLGRSIFLGTQTAMITDPYIEEIDRVQEELACGDGHEVTILIRSHTNRAQYSLPEAPRLPLNPWDPRIESLIDLERELDSRLVERYHALAAGSLAGLTDEEKKRVTTRPQLNKPSLLAILMEKLGL